MDALCNIGTDTTISLSAIVVPLDQETTVGPCWPVDVIDASIKINRQ